MPIVDARHRLGAAREDRRGPLRAGGRGGGGVRPRAGARRPLRVAAGRPARAARACCRGRSWSARRLLVVIDGGGTDGARWRAAACGGRRRGSLPPLGSCVRARWASAAAPSGRNDLLEHGVRAGVGRRRGGLHRRAGARSWGSASSSTRRPACWPRLALCVAGHAGVRRAAQHRAAGRAAGRRHARGRRCASSALRTAALSMVFVGVLFGSLEVVMVAFADEQGRPSAAGVPAAARGRWAARRPGSSTARARGGPRWTCATSSRCSRSPSASCRCCSRRRRVDGARRRSWPGWRSARRSSRRSAWSSSSCRRRRGPRASPGSTPAWAWASPSARRWAVRLADGPGARTAFLTCLGGALARARRAGSAGRRTLRPVSSQQEWRQEVAP